MKLKALLTLIATAVTFPAFAILTDAESTSADYLRNHGYSTTTAELVQLQKAQINGTKYVAPEEPEYYNAKGVKAVRKFFIYLDPALKNDARGIYGMHDTNYSGPNVNDL